MVAKDTFPFATVTDGCKEANFMRFSHYIYKNWFTSRKHVFTYEFGKKKCQFHFSFFKVDSQNPKFNSEYLGKKKNF